MSNAKESLIARLCKDIRSRGSSFMSCTILIQGKERKSSSDASDGRPASFSGLPHRQQIQAKQKFEYSLKVKVHLQEAFDAAVASNIEELGLEVGRRLSFRESKVWSAKC